MESTRIRTFLTRHRARVAYTAACAALATAAPTQAATIIVTTAADGVLNTTCTLRAAIQSINTASLAGTACVNTGAAFGAGDTINFDPAVTNILLSDIPNNSLNITVNNLVISGSVSVNRALAAVNGFRIFNHSGTGTLTLIGLDIRGGLTNANNARGGGVFSAGNLSLQNVHMESNETLGTNSGGGAAHVDNSMTLSNTRVTNNATRGNSSPGGALSAFVFVSASNSTIFTNSTFGQGSNGGGIASGNGVAASLDLISTQLVGNRVESAALTPRGGGAISFGTTRVLNSLVGQNSVNGGDGGGLFVFAGGATVEQSTFRFNSSGTGGGALSLFASSASSTVTNSTFWRNNASSGAANVGNGGAIYNLGTLSIRSATFRENIAGGLGGGVFNNGGSLVLQSTIIANSSSQSAASPAPDVDIHSNGVITVTGANNLVRVVANVTMPVGTLTGDPLLEGIADNGCAAPAGATPFTICPTTMLPGAGSPAINAGNNAAGVATDQRGAGFPRVVGAAADIGAIESGTVAPITWPITVTIAGVTTGGSVACTPNPVPNGSTATCVPSPATGFVFVAFAGDCTGATCTLINVTAARNITATFAIATAAATPQPVPTLGVWAMSALMLLLFVFALHQFRRRSNE